MEHSSFYSIIVVIIVWCHGNTIQITIFRIPLGSAIIGIISVEGLPIRIISPSSIRISSEHVTFGLFSSHRITSLLNHSNLLPQVYQFAD